MACFDILQRNAPRVPIRQKPATDADVMQPRLPIRTLLLQMLREPEQSLMNRYRWRPLSLYVPQQRMNPGRQTTSPLNEPARPLAMLPAEPI